MSTTPSVFDNQRLELKYVPLSDIKPSKRQIRNYSSMERRRIVKLLQIMGPIALCVSADMTNLSGDHWPDCLKQAGITEVPVVIMGHLTPELADLFMVAQVGMIERGTWNEQELGRLYLDLSISNPDLDLTIAGHDLPQIDLLIQVLSISGVEDETSMAAIAAASEGPPVSRRGDLFFLGCHKVLCGDARDAEAVKLLIGSVMAKMAISDLPYNVRIEDVSGFGQTKHREFEVASGEMSKPEFITFLTGVIRLMSERCVDGALLYLFMDWRHMSELLAAAEAVGLTLINLCVWAKANAGMGSFYRSQHELVFVFRKSNAPHLNNNMLGKHGRNRSNLWSYSAAPGFGRASDEGNLERLHPTVKPLPMIADAMLDTTNRGDVVLDFFLGSGTAVIAAEKAGRSLYGMEIDPDYVDLIVRRWQAWTGEKAIHMETGLTFEELAAKRSGGKDV